MTKNNNQIVQSNQYKRILCPSYDNEEISDKWHKLVKDIVASAHDFNFEVEEKYVRELLELVH